MSLLDVNSTLGENVEQVKKRNKREYSTAALASLDVGGVLRYNVQLGGGWSIKVLQLTSGENLCKDGMVWNI